VRSSRSALSRTVTVLIVIAILVVAAGAVYFVSTGMSKTTQQTSARTSLTVEEEDQPDSLDPAVTYVTPGWEVVDQVYQGLITYNGSSITQYEGVLAKSWAV